MTQTYGTRPEAVLGAIGPSIGDCCYEVDHRVIEQLEPLVKSILIGQSASPDSLIRMVENGKAMVNLKEINRYIM